MTKWIRADHAQAEKEAAVAAAYEDVRVMLREIYSRDGYMSPELKAIHDRLACAASSPSSPAALIPPIKRGKNDE